MLGLRLKSFRSGMPAVKSKGQGATSTSVAEPLLTVGASRNSAHVRRAERSVWIEPFSVGFPSLLHGFPLIFHGFSICFYRFLLFSMCFLLFSIGSGTDSHLTPIHFHAFQGRNALGHGRVLSFFKQKSLQALQQVLRGRRVPQVAPHNKTIITIIAIYSNNKN